MKSRLLSRFAVKLIEAGIQYAPADLLARANHTGTQPAATISDLAATIAAHADVAANTAQRRSVATQAQAEAGTDNTTDMTPLRVLQAMQAKGGAIVASYYGLGGYVKFGNGFMIQWDYLGNLGSGTYTYNFPITWPNACMSIMVTPTYSASVTAGANAISNAQYQIINNGALEVRSWRMLAVGF